MIDSKKKLEDELDKQLRLREKLDVQLATTKQSLNSLRLGANECRFGPLQIFGLLLIFVFLFSKNSPVVVFSCRLKLLFWVLDII